MPCKYCGKPALRIVVGIGELCKEHGFSMQKRVNELLDHDRSNDDLRVTKDGRAKDRIGRYKCAKFSKKKRKP